MRTIRSIDRKGTSIATGVQVATLVVIIGIIAAISDHALLTAGAAVQTGNSTEYQVSTGVPASIGGFEVPDHLRANAGEVPTPIVTF